MKRRKARLRVISTYGIKPSQSVRGLVAAFFTLPLFQVREQAKNQNGHVDGQRKNFVYRHLAYLPYPVFQPKPVEFGRQPPGAERFHWVQYTMVCLYSKVCVEKAALGGVLPVVLPILPAVQAKYYTWYILHPRKTVDFSNLLW